MFPLLSHFQAQEIITARTSGQANTLTSADLGMTRIMVLLTVTGVVLPDQSSVPWEDIEAIASDANDCWIIEDHRARVLRRYSEATGHTYRLMPTRNAPALIISGFNMHRILNTTPREAANAMVRALGRVHGDILDTTTGLGYTAIALSAASRVVTIEKDPVSTEMARFNPWSQALFNNPRITCVSGDSVSEIQGFPDASFAAIMHDPPSIQLAGELYAGTFYEQAFRVLNSKGKLFHYIGDPTSALGSRTTQGVIRRLHRAGFARVEQKKEAFGVVAFKA